MTKAVISTHFPYLPINIQIGILSSQQKLQIEALVDTGFDNAISIPKSLIKPSIKPDGEIIVGLADDTEVVVNLYYGYVQLGKNEQIPAEIIALGDEEPLLGRYITSLFKVTLDHGQKLIIEP
jgi:predicted aspartyl protease